MMKTSTLVAATTLIAGGAVTGAQLAVSSNTDKSIDQLLSQASKSSILDINVLEDDSSLVHRSLTLELLFHPDENTRITFISENEIQQFPWGAKVTHNVSLGRNSFGLNGDESAPEWFNKYFVDQAFLTGESTVNLLATTSSSWSSKPFYGQAEDIELQLSALNLNVTVDRNSNMTSEMEWPGLTVKDRTSLMPKSLSMSGVKQSFGGDFASWPVIMGQGIFGIDQIKYEDEAEGESFVVDQVLMASNAFTEGNVLSSEYRVDIDRVSMQDRRNDASIDDLVMDLALKSQDAQAFIQFQQTLQSMDTNNDPAALEKLLPAIQLVFQKGIQLSVRKVSASVNGVSLNANMSAQIDPNNIPVSMDPYYFNQMKPFVQASALVQIDKAANQEPLLSEYLMGMLFMGILVDQGEHYELNASFKNGAPVLNGNLIPIPF